MNFQIEQITNFVIQGGEIVLNNFKAIPKAGKSKQERLARYILEEQGSESKEIAVEEEDFQQELYANQLRESTRSPPLKAF